MQQLITAKQASERIGVSVTTVKTWINRQDAPLPSIQVGKTGSHRRILADQIEPWLASEASRKTGQVK